MRILVISDTTGYMRGGVPAEKNQLVRGLVGRGHTLAYCGDIAVPDSPEVAFSPLTLPVRDQFEAEVRAALKAARPDFVHVISMSSVGLHVIAPLLGERPWAATCHSISPYERKLPALHGSEAAHYSVRALRFLANTLAWRWVLRSGRVRHMIVHSGWVGDEIARYGYDACETTLIPLGCDLDGVDGGEARPLGATVEVVTTGGIAHTKGYHDALRALASVRRDVFGLRYQIIGEVRDRSYLAHLHSLIDRLNLEDIVQITPNLSNEDKRRALHAADLYVQPSHEEGFCLAYIEAAPIVPRLVGADTGAIRRISEGDAGARVVPVRRPQAIAAAMLELLQAELPGDLMAARRRRLGREFSWSTYLDAHERLYERLCERSRTRSSGHRQPVSRPSPFA